LILKAPLTILIIQLFALPLLLDHVLLIHQQVPLWKREVRDVPSHNPKSLIPLVPVAHNPPVVRNVNQILQLLRAELVAPSSVDRIPHCPVALACRSRHRLSEDTASKFGQLRAVGAVPGPPMHHATLPLLHGQSISNGTRHAKAALEFQEGHESLLQDEGGAPLPHTLPGNGLSLVVAGDEVFEDFGALHIIQEDLFHLVARIKDPTNHVEGAGKAAIPARLDKLVNLPFLPPRQQLLPILPSSSCFTSTVSCSM
ncbi:hypothetical protein CLOP_g11481, partial [Closterium sp. NIES-67]